MIKLTPHLEGILNKAKSAALSLNHPSVGEDLFFNSFMSEISMTCSNALEKCGIKAEGLWEESNKYIQYKQKAKSSDNLSKKTRSILDFAEQLAVDQFQQDYLSPEILFLAFFSDEHIPKAIKSFFSVKTTEEIVSDPTIQKLFERITAVIKDKEEILENGGGIFAQEEKDDGPSDWISMFEDNPILSKFAENLNIKAANGEFDKFVDFDNKVEEISTILCRKKKPNVILVGVAGGGKTSLAQALAEKIVKGESPDLLCNKVIYSLNLSSMVAGTQYRGQFEKRLEEFIVEAKKYSNLILFIDEIHTLVGAGGGSSSSLEASNILKPALADGSISCIGATTINEYTHTIKRDAALDRRFERVIVRAPSKFKMQEILPDILEYYEEFHGVKYSQEFISNVVDFCERFMPNRNYPDKAIDVIDHCGAQAKVKFWEMDQEVKEQQKSIMQSVEQNGSVPNAELENLNEKIVAWEEKIMESNAEVTLNHLKSFFETKGNPLNKISTISAISQDIKSSFIGNKKSLISLFEKLKTSTLGISHKHNPAAPDVFLVSGEGSTGKTLLCQTLRNSLEKIGANVLSYNGTEFSDSYGPYKIVSPQNNNTSLAEKVLIYPNSVIIIDDFEKVHWSCDGLLSQIFKEGKVQMANGDIADFSNCKIFLTSGAKTGVSMGFHKNESSSDSNASKDLVGLIEYKFPLSPLNKAGLRRILFNKLKLVQASANLQNCHFSFNFPFLKRFVDENFKEEGSVKVLNDSIEKKLIPDLSKRILNGEKKIQLFS